MQFVKCGFNIIFKNQSQTLGQQQLSLQFISRGQSHPQKMLKLAI